MKRARGGKAIRTKTVELKAKHANAVRKTHVLNLTLFILIGLGVLLVGFIYVYNEYDQQRQLSSISRDQLDYANYQSAPIDIITFGVLAGGLILSIFGVTLTALAMYKHNAKHHVYRVASGHYVPVPHKQYRKLAKDIPFAVGQTEESRRQAQSAARQNTPASNPEPNKPRNILIQ